MESELSPRLRELLSIRAGVQLSDEDERTLRRVVAARMKTLRLGDSAEYFALLSGTSPPAVEEFERLLSLLMVGETYFFRDEGQFAALRANVLPEIMRRRSGEKTLRIWSAGCATGEEPYSLAILLREMYGELSDWRVSIIGSDINDDFLEKARKGVYRQWSLRETPPELVRRYFHRRKETFLLDDAVRRRVKFVKGNLYRDEYPDYGRGLHSMDLIICRNVFIYFHATAVAGIVGKLINTLEPDGYLITGHAELSFIPTSGLSARLFPQTVVYQRARPPEPKPPERSRPSIVTAPGPAIAAPENTAPAEPPLHEARRLFGMAAYGRVVSLLEPHVHDRPKEEDAPLLLLIASAHANMGAHDRAAYYLGLAQQADRLAAEPHFIAAHIAIERGDLEEAKESLKKTIYLDHDFIPAYVALADIYSAERDAKRADKMRRTALSALEKLAPETRLPHYEEITAGEMTQIILNALRQYPAD